MGCSTGNLVIDDDESLHAVFEIAAAQNLLVAVHAEDEARINAQKHKFAGSKNYCDHSLIRDPEVAAIATEKAIALTRRYGTRLYVLHASTADEIALITQAKKAALPVYAETTPHHLFLSDASYATLQGKAVVNPPLRSESHQQVLWSALRDGIIDTIGSDHAPHTTDEKARPYGECPSGMPGIETTLPLLLNAHHQGMLSLERILELTASKPREIFQLPANEDVVLVDLEKIATVTNQNLKTKCGWSSFAGQRLQGWPVYTIVAGYCFELNKL
jgi:dihydroorotase